MRPIDESVAGKLSLLKALKPEDIFEVEDCYDPSVPTTGPWLDPKTKSTYFGQCQNKQPHGWGRLVTQTGEVIDGFFMNGIPDVYVRVVYLDGSMYQGCIRNLKKNGLGVFVDSSGHSTASKWVDDQADDMTIVKGLDDQIIFQGTIKQGMRDGEGFFKDYIHGYEYKGRFSLNLYNGYGVKIYTNGQVYKGNFVDGLEDGNGTLTFNDGRVFSGQFFKGVPHGTGDLTSDEGKTRSVTYHHGKLQL